MYLYDAVKLHGIDAERQLQSYSANFELTPFVVEKHFILLLPPPLPYMFSSAGIFVHHFRCWVSSNKRIFFFEEIDRMYLCIPPIIAFAFCFLLFAFVCASFSLHFFVHGNLFTLCSMCAKGLCGALDIVFTLHWYVNPFFRLATIFFFLDSGLASTQEKLFLCHFLFILV